MGDLYTRTEMLIGDGAEKLKNSSVIVFGCGGVGSFVIEALARAGVGTLTVVDSDTVDVTNLNRQLIATVDTVGRDKATVQKLRILSINPNCNADGLVLFFDKTTADKIDLSKYDYICDAIDSVTSKIFLIEKAAELNIPIISSMGTGNKLDPTKFEITDIYKTSVCPLARVMRRELKARGIKKLKVLYSKEKPVSPLQNPDASPQSGKRSTPASISFVPGAAGLIIAGEIICDLAEIER